jgi:hypothetical protein
MSPIENRDFFDSDSKEYSASLEHDPDCCRMHASLGTYSHCCCKEDDENRSTDQK